MLEKDTTESHSKRMTSFILNTDTLNSFKALCTKEGTSMSKLVEEFMLKYNKEHGDGNPQFTIDQFEDPNFIACPAFYRSGQTWHNWLSKQDPKEHEKVKQQILLIEKKLLEVSG